MELWRKHWFDVGGALALPLAAWLYWQRAGLTDLQLLLGLSLLALLVHQLEEYRWPGYFPGMLNATVYNSQLPDRYPLNPQTALVINVVLGWVAYALALVFARQLPWLGIATMLVSLGNVVAHTLFFNYRGRTWYNPGMATALLLFGPLVGLFGRVVWQQHLATSADWLLGIGSGVLLNYVGIVRLIHWRANRFTPYWFEPRQLRPADRAAQSVADA